ncbi:MAG: Ku protein [Deltaproteobacteria bacterium]|nr:Ku protein [Deltaproteobacteria bacterium]
MALRSIATGTVSFGMVSIPVKLYSATQASAAISFNLLHKKDGSRLKQQYVCQTCNDKVERDDMVKGYEFAKDQYVMLTPEELSALEEKSTQTIEISEFIPIEKIDPIYFEKPYFLGPDKGGDKAYKLLATTLENTGKAALARYAARGKQYLVLLRPKEGRLVMQQLMYADEVRSWEEVEVPTVEVKEAELKLAAQLVEATSNPAFEPEKYQDDVRTRVKELIEKKVAGQEITSAPAEQGKAQIIDIMEALKASLAKRAGGGEAAAGASEERRPAKRKDDAAPAAAAAVATAAVAVAQAGAAGAGERAPKRKASKK